MPKGAVETPVTHQKIRDDGGGIFTKATSPLKLSVTLFLQSVRSVHETSCLSLLGLSLLMS